MSLKNNKILIVTIWPKTFYSSAYSTEKITVLPVDKQIGHDCCSVLPFHLSMLVGLGKVLCLLFRIFCLFVFFHLNRNNGFQSKIVRMCRYMLGLIYMAIHRLWPPSHHIFMCNYDTYCNAWVYGLIVNKTQLRSSYNSNKNNKVTAACIYIYIYIYTHMIYASVDQVQITCGIDIA